MRCRTLIAWNTQLHRGLSFSFIAVCVESLLIFLLIIVKNIVGKRSQLDFSCQKESLKKFLDPELIPQPNQLFLFLGSINPDQSSQLVFLSYPANKPVNTVSGDLVMKKVLFVVMKTEFIFEPQCCVRCTLRRSLSGLQQTCCWKVTKEPPNEENPHFRSHPCSYCPPTSKYMPKNLVLFSSSEIKNACNQLICQSDFSLSISLKFSL